MPSKYYGILSEIGANATERLSSRNAAREQALGISRDVIRLSANAIRAVHRGEFDQARQLIQRGGERLAETEAIREDNSLIYNAGFLADARKEYCEANITLAVISGDALPHPAELNVDPAPYLNGMAEVIGEVRRYILDALRRDVFDGCQEMMDVMDEIYGMLVTIDFPEGVTGGLRHSTDQMRGVLERTRGDLTMALRQHKLEAQLAQWERRQSGSSG